MKEKLDKFYMEDLAPEIIDSRIKRNMEYRQSKYRMDAINKRAEELAVNEKTTNQ